MKSGIQRIFEAYSLIIFNFNNFSVWNEGDSSLPRFPYIWQVPLRYNHQSKWFIHGSKLISLWGFGSSSLNNSFVFCFITTSALTKLADSHLWPYSPFVLLLTLWAWCKRILLLVFYFPLIFLSHVFTVQLIYLFSTKCSNLQHCDCFSLKATSLLSHCTYN